MKVICCDAEFEVPDFVIEKFINDFNGLSNSKNRESVLELRDSIENTIGVVADDPEMLYDKEYLADFIRAIAMREALEHHGILYDA